jgi:FMN phosphatase YigB (HAD superfamily)
LSVSPSPSRALLLDALGTIVELPPPAPALREEVRRRFGIELSEAEAARGIAAEIAFYRAHFDRGRDARSLARLRRRCAEVLRDATPPLSGADPASLTDALLASLRFRAHADAAPAIAAARERGLRVVVVSNWDVSLPDTLARIGLLPGLDGVITSAGVGSRKPEATPFLRALSLAEVPDPADAIHVGDSVREDVEGAAGAGVRPVLLRRGGDAAAAGAPMPGPAVPVIAGLAELGRLL